jgi:hypothetical protein
MVFLEPARFIFFFVGKEVGPTTLWKVATLSGSVKVFRACQNYPPPWIYKRWVAFGLLCPHSRLYGSNSFEFHEQL